MQEFCPNHLLEEAKIQFVSGGFFYMLMIRRHAMMLTDKELLVHFSLGISASTQAFVKQQLANESNEHLEKDLGSSVDVR